MAYAISWIGTKTNKEHTGPTLYKYIEIRDQDRMKKVLMKREDAKKLCKKANKDKTWGGLQHSVVEVDERENVERENSDEEILGKKFWRENFDKMIEREGQYE